MCGITGLLRQHDPLNEKDLEGLYNSVEALRSRGPDNNGTARWDRVALGHTRLSVIDPSVQGGQPMTDPSGRYTIVYNGEVYNYRELRKELLDRGHSFRSGTDTEVVLHAFMEKGTACLNELNGFFAFAVYDRSTGDLFLARDRMGIKPLIFYDDGESFFFSSQMRGLMAYPLPRKELDPESLYTYLQLSYIPAPDAILKHVSKLRPGEYLWVSNGRVTRSCYYEIPAASSRRSGPSNYKEACEGLRERLDNAVRKRLNADVQLGAFLSGGIDSSVIASVAADHVSGLQTFSIGYEGGSFHDETAYAKEVAKHIGCEHTVFQVSDQMMLDRVEDVFDALDEPFADSSSLAVHILSQKTRERVTVALSGDGADELFSGYNKHAAEYLVREGGLLNSVAKWGNPLWKRFSGSRESKVGDVFRKIQRYAEGVSRSPADRYWRWASSLGEAEARELMALDTDPRAFEERRKEYLKELGDQGTIEDVLRNDLHLVLPSDMLTKVDLMSMAHGLEVRTPYLDHELVDHVVRLPLRFKIGPSMKKRILRDAYRDRLPVSLYKRPKQGFEVPIGKWLRKELRPEMEHLLAPDRIRGQGIFRPEAVQRLIQKAISADPGDAPNSVWTLMVFQKWWFRYMDPE